MRLIAIAGKATTTAVAICCLSGIIGPAPLRSSPNRVAALGGEQGFIVDPTNIPDYPARAMDLPHASVEIFDDWASAVVPVGGGAVGLFLDRPTRDLRDVDAYVASAGSALFRQLQAEPWLDLVCAARLSGSLAMGLGGGFAYDQLEAGGGEASVSSARLRLGVRLAAAGRQVDASLGISRRRFSDQPADGNRLEQTAGDGFDVDIRGRIALSPRLTLVPTVALVSRSGALEPDRREIQHARIGLALNARPTGKVLAIAGLVVGRDEVTHRSPGQPGADERLLTLPAIVGAGEAQVGSLVFRLGLRQENTIIEVETIDSGSRRRSRDFDSRLRTDLGIGMEFGPILLDGLLEKDFLRDGPHLIGGSRHGGGVFSNLSVTYRFSQ